MEPVGKYSQVVDEVKKIIDHRHPELRYALRLCPRTRHVVHLLSEEPENERIVRLLFDLCDDLRDAGFDVRLIRMGPRTEDIRDRPLRGLDVRLFA